MTQKPCPECGNQIDDLLKEMLASLETTGQAVCLAEPCDVCMALVAAQFKGRRFDITVKGGRVVSAKLIEEDDA